MKMKDRARHVVASVLVLVTIATSLLPAVSTQAASNGLGITPRKNYTVQPGAKVSDTLYINNLSQTQPLHVTLRIIDFSAKDETGSPALQLSKNAPAVPWSLKPFASIPPDVTVPAGKSANIPITISIPADQGGGSYYGAIEYTAGNGTEAENVKLAASSVSLIFVTVPGQTQESLKLKQFGAFVPTADGLGGGFSSWFFTSPPKVLAYRLQNSGNVAEVPNGSILLKNSFGKQVKTIERANPKQQLALIGQTRRFDACIEQDKQTTKAVNGQEQAQITCKSPKLMPGRYTANLDIFYGLNGNPSQEITAVATFWYLPVWFLIVAGVVIVAIVGSIYWVVHKIKRPRSKKK